VSLVGFFSNVSRSVRDSRSISRSFRSSVVFIMNTSTYTFPLLTIYVPVKGGAAKPERIDFSADLQLAGARSGKFNPD
jgi:hypothetical protein